MLRVKICGLTQPQQAQAIAQLGATALGFICVRQSPRYVTPADIRTMTEALAEMALAPPPDRVGVFVDADLDEIAQVVAIAHLTAVQLHGNESPDFCRHLRTRLPQVELIKALRIRHSAALVQAHHYQDWVDTLLLDAYHPHLMGGTGHTVDWAILHDFRPAIPWFLAGGITPDNVLEAIAQTAPDGIDLSSGVEIAPGHKNLDQVAQLFRQLQGVTVKTQH